MNVIEINFCFQVNLINSTNPELTCDFENGLCDWLQEESRDSEDWLRNKGFTKSQSEFIKDNVLYKTGPQDTNNARKGNLLNRDTSIHFSFSIVSF